MHSFRDIVSISGTLRPFSLAVDGRLIVGSSLLYTTLLLLMLRASSTQSKPNSLADAMRGPQNLHAVNQQRKRDG